MLKFYLGKHTKTKKDLFLAGGDSNLYGYVLGNPVGFVDPEGEHRVLTIISSLGTIYTLWTWYDNFRDNNAKKDIRDTQCSKITDPITREICYKESNRDRNRDARQNSCEVGSGLTEDIAGFRY